MNTAAGNYKSLSVFELKEMGNKQFKAGEYGQALRSYFTAQSSLQKIISTQDSHSSKKGEDGTNGSAASRLQLLSTLHTNAATACWKALESVDPALVTAASSAAGVSDTALDDAFLDVYVSDIEYLCIAGASTTTTSSNNNTKHCFRCCRCCCCGFC